MDTVGYIGWNQWDEIIKRTGWSTDKLRDNRYNAVLHLVTAADGKSEFYNMDNAARYENVEEAVIRDKALRSAYVGHNNLYFFNNHHDKGFSGKMNEVTNTVLSLLGLPTKMSRYKKYLLDTRFVKGDQDPLTFHQVLFNRTGKKPFSFEYDKDNEFHF